MQCIIVADAKPMRVAEHRLPGRRSLILGSLAAPAFAAEAAPGPASDSIEALLADRIEIGRDSVGYVAGIIDDDGRRLITTGLSDAADGRPLDGDTVFEVGSITKVFTALLLADMVARGEVAMVDPVAKYLPPEGQPRAFDGKAITLLDLVTYTSGLPRMPTNFAPKDRANPYADYTVQQLYQFVSGFTPRYYPGTHYEYANLGFGLLGHALSLRAGRGYEDLVIARICDPLGLADTRITLTPGMQARLTPGHDSELRKVSNWDLPTLAGAGALRSTANDLVRFLEACTGRRETPLQGAFASLIEVRRPANLSGTYAAAEGWFVTTAHDDELVFKDGGTGGYATFIGYSTRSRVAAVLLSNAAGWESTPALGRHLLNADYPLPTLNRQIAAIDAAKLAAYAGRYALTPAFVLTVTVKDGRLMVQATGQDEFEVFPESETRFFYRVVDAQITFELGPDGTASALVLHQNGRNRRGGRLP